MFIKQSYSTTKRFPSLTLIGPCVQEHKNISILFWIITYDITMYTIELRDFYALLFIVHVSPISTQIGDGQPYL